MAIAEILGRVAAELALFAGVGFLLFGINDLLVDLIYFVARGLAFADRLPPPSRDSTPANSYFNEQARLHRDVGAGLGRICGHRLDVQGNAPPARL